MESFPFRKILVIRLSSLGDVARLLPSLKGLREGAPGLRVDLTVEDRFAGLLALFPYADSVIPYPRRGAGSPLTSPLRFFRAMAKYAGEIRRARYDLALDLHGILRSAAIARLSGARRTAGYASGFGKEGSHLLLDLPLVPGPQPRISRFERYAGALSALGLPAPATLYLEPDLPPEAAAAAGAFLAAGGLKEGEFLFAFLGTSRAQARKRWPPSHFVETAKVLWDARRWPTVVGWGPDEAELVAALPRSEWLHPMPPLDLAGLVALVRSAGAFAGADTGAMHLSALMGVPTVAILGPTDPVLNRPFGERAVVVHRVEARRACPGTGCPHRDCMALITAGEVARVLLDLLDAHPPPSKRGPE